MYAGYKHARRKYQERQARQAGEAQGQEYGLAPPIGEQIQLGPADRGEPNVQKLTLEEKAEKRRRRNYRFKVVFGLALPFMLQALDTTIVAAALPTIAQEFSTVSQQNWIISAFNLTAAAFLPFWAQAADIFGRHTTIQVTVILMMIGSAICTGAPTHAFPALLVGRAVQGVGAAGVNICVRTILADKVSLADYALNWTLFAVISAVGYTVGPVIGGYLTEDTWRWCFAINLPVAALAVVSVLLILRKELLGPQPLPELAAAAAAASYEGGSTARGARRARLLVRIGTIDFVGQLLFLFGLGLVILALTWAGNGQSGTYRWDSAQVLAPLVVGVVLTALWFAFEYSMAPGRAMSRVFTRQRPMMPWKLFENKDIAILFYVNFSYGMCLYAVMYFMDYYFQYVRGQSASNAGQALLYFLPGLGVGAYVAVFMLNRFPRQTLYPIKLGAVTSAVGVTMLSQAILKNNVNLVYGMMALAGFGVGASMSPSTTHGLAQLPANTAQITCVFAFAMPFGGALGVTIMNTVWNNKLGPNDEYVQSAIAYAYYAILPFLWLSVLSTWFLGNVWVKKDGHHEVVMGPYLLTLLRGKKPVKETRARGGGDWSSTPAQEWQKEGQTAEPV
ncbi:MFS general substrate transporter [Cryphonectria parasitica EP155]|uniref:MFS general substrate transporter n=1 Tax=Cryphonectria parasitica (strain ATCC 38755 / EP155) TaxID=660469 RepID=A0A9P4Y5W1_CRYP1|nr:MFS general substrate transporter [Cryphonectria parasitica EP155]KAF3766932.1 MFS general substrate transporter [Cryphonectria parasitica EP155]